MESRKKQWLNPPKRTDSSHFPRLVMAGLQDDPVEADLMHRAAPLDTALPSEGRVNPGWKRPRGMFGQGRTWGCCCSSENVAAPSSLPCCCGAGISSTGACESCIGAGGLVHLFTGMDSTAKQRKIFRLEFAFVTKRFSLDFHALGGFCTNYMCIAVKIATLPFTF